MPSRSPVLSKTMDSAPATVAIPGGGFLMGSEHGRPDERPVHITEVGPFRMAVTPITVRQYAAFVATGHAEAPPWWDDADFAEPDQPVVGITWFDAAAFAGWLTDRTGDAWRLPTEAEWERAARGGLEQAPTAWGARVPDGEIPEGALRGPWPVGRGTPNAFGLCDMGTVVHEWCLDVYRPDRTSDAVDEDRGPERRASRGGSWRHRQRWSPPSARSSLPPAFRYADYGFRPIHAG
jgi:formylglycine-generating enzyme required for sulfatase activity